MDKLRFEELKHSITYGGLPDVSSETFTPEQIGEIKTICQERADKSLSYVSGLNFEGRHEETTAPLGIGMNLSENTNNVEVITETTT